MRIVQRFTTSGKLGIFFLFAGPLMSGAAYALWLSAFRTSIVARSGPVDFAPYMIVMVIGAVLGLAAFPMMIIGRDFEGYEQTRLSKADMDMWQ